MPNCHADKSVGDGAPLVGADHPIEITSEMVNAGSLAGRDAWAAENKWPDVARAVFKAMAMAAPAVPDDISEGSVVTTKHPLEMVMESIKTDCERTDPDDLVAQRKLVNRIYNAACLVLR